MSKILKNTTGSIVVITDVGQQVPASGQLTISPSDYDKYAQSSDVLVYIGDGTLIVNDGSTDLSISDGIDLIKGLFPSSMIVKGQMDDLASVSAAEGDFASVRVTQFRGLHVNLRNVSGAEIGDKSIPVYIDPLNLGQTNQYTGTVGTTPIDVPSVSGSRILDMFIHCKHQTPLSKRLKYSIDGGSHYFDLIPGESIGWPLLGNIFQVRLQGSVSGVEYEVMLNTQED